MEAGGGMGHEEVSEAQDDEKCREGLKEVRCAEHAEAVVHE